MWQRWTGVDDWPRWNPACAAARVDGPLAEGTTLDLRLVHPSGREFLTRPVVTAVEPGRRVEWAARAPGLDARTETLLIPEADGTRVVVTALAHGPLAFTYRLVMRRTTQRAIYERMLEGLHRDLTDA